MAKCGSSSESEFLLTCLRNPIDISISLPCFIHLLQPRLESGLLKIKTRRMKRTIEERKRASPLGASISSSGSICAQLQTELRSFSQGKFLLMMHLIMTPGPKPSVLLTDSLIGSHSTISKPNSKLFTSWYPYLILYLVVNDTRIPCQILTNSSEMLAHFNIHK